MADSEDIEVLKRRGRRRLLGAIALVLLAVIVLPMVFDREPTESSVPVSVRIPSEDSAPLVAKSTSQIATQTALPSADDGSSPAAKPVPPAVAGQGEIQSSAGQSVKPSAVAQEVPQPAVSVAPPAREAKAAGPQFIIPVVALANRDKVKEVTDLLAAAKLPYYTEAIVTAKGTVTGVRVGPYEDRKTAERARKKLKELGQQLKELGVTPGAITTRSG